MMIRKSVSLLSTKILVRSSKNQLAMPFLKVSFMIFGRKPSKFRDGNPNQEKDTQLLSIKIML